MLYVCNKLAYFGFNLDRKSTCSTEFWDQFWAIFSTFYIIKLCLVLGFIIGNISCAPGGFKDSIPIIPTHMHANPMYTYA